MALTVFDEGAALVDRIGAVQKQRAQIGLHDMRAVRGKPHALLFRLLRTRKEAVKVGKGRQKGPCFPIELCGQQFHRAAGYGQHPASLRHRCAGAQHERRQYHDECETFQAFCLL